MSENPYDEVTTDGGEDRPEVDRDFTGPDGVQDADAILELERERDVSERTDSAADFPVELGEEDVAAAEQGNRDGDEMVAEGEDPREVAELDGDDEDVDAFEDEPFTEDDPLRRER